MNKKYRLIPPVNTEMMHWAKENLDLVGHWKLRLKVKLNISVQHILDFTILDDATF